MPPPPDPAWRAAIAAAARQGDHLLAYDLSRQALESHQDHLEYEYTALLALARSGVTTAARTRLQSLAGRIAPLQDQDLARDFATLDGRLWTDQAARSTPPEAIACWRQAAQAYEAAAERFGGAYPTINAATCHLAAGNRAAAQPLAHRALAAATEDDYWSIATRIEALLILGRGPEAAQADRAIPPEPDPDQIATTRRQLALVTHLTGTAFDPALLPTPHILAWPSSDTPITAEQTPPILAGHPTLIFLPLLTAADLTTTTTLAAAGALMHLVLPCAPDVWLETHPNGAALASSLQAALSVAAEPLRVTAEGGVGEPAARHLCQRQATGLAILRARALAVAPQSVRHANGAWEPISLNPSPATPPAPPYPTALHRHPSAILFGDVRGFSKLTEAEQLRFLDTIIGGFADVLNTTPAVEYAETAGDGLFVVLSDITAAAACCFALQTTLNPARIAEANLPPHLALRLSAHVGPLHRRFDPVIKREKFCGMEVIRTARIEPVTPAGEIFVTEPFAATLAAEAPEAFVCEYVGRQAMAKGFGACRMYSLRRT